MKIKLGLLSIKLQRISKVRRAGENVVSHIFFLTGESIEVKCNVLWPESNRYTFPGSVDELKAFILQKVSVSVYCSPSSLCDGCSCANVRLPVEARSESRLFRSKRVYRCLNCDLWDYGIGGVIFSDFAIKFTFFSFFVIFYDIFFILCTKRGKKFCH